MSESADLRQTQSRLKGYGLSKSVCYIGVTGDISGGGGVFVLEMNSDHRSINLSLDPDGGSGDNHPKVSLLVEDKVKEG